MKLKSFLNKNLLFLLPILSGVLLTLVYPPYDLEFLIWVSLIPLFYFLSLKQVSLKKAFIGGSLAGLVFFGKLFSWYFATIPFEWLGITNKKAVFFAFCLLVLFWAIQAAFLSLFIGLFAWITKKIILWRKINFLYPFILPCAWVIFEYLRAFGFGILWLGKETAFGSHWTFGNLAYALHNRLNLIQIADIGGIYIISFLIVFINTILFLLLRSHLRVRPLGFSIVILVFVGLAWNGYGVYQLTKTENEKQTTIALVQTNFPSEIKPNPRRVKEIFETTLNLLTNQTAISKNPDLVVFPEGFGLVSLAGDQEIAKYLLKDFWRSGQIFIENKKIIDENTNSKSRLFYYDLEKENPVSHHDKMLLIPNGDFFPYLTKFFLNFYSFGIKNKQRFYSKGKEAKIAQTQKGNIGGTICSSIISPIIQRQMTTKGAELLIVVSSDAPFHGSNALLSQNLAMSKIRAIENRRYFGQSTNMGYSFLLNSKGKIIAKSSKIGNEVLVSKLFLSNKKTIYTKFGDWIIFFAILGLSTIYLLSVLCYNRNNKI